MEFEEILSQGVGRSASDVHLKPHAHPILRIHGALELQQDMPGYPHDQHFFFVSHQRPNGLANSYML